MNPKLKRILRYIAIFMTIVWMIVIFRFSMDDGILHMNYQIHV